MINSIFRLYDRGWKHVEARVARVTAYLYYWGEVGGGSEQQSPAAPLVT